jgi:diguanylate cyclase (GGDEF)-like protein
MSTSAPLASRAFDGLVLLVGLSIAIYAATNAALNEDHFRLALLCVPLVVVIARFPMLLDRGGGGLEIGFDSCVLMFLLCSVRPHVALTVWSLAVIATQLMNHKQLASRLFNVGVGILGGAAATVLVAQIRGNAFGEPRELLAVALAAVGYFSIDFVLSAISVAIEQRGSPWEELRQPGVMLAVACFVPFDCLGYLAAVVSRSTPWWTWGLLAVPLMTLLVATRAVTRGRENSRRLSVLFDAAVRLQNVSDEHGAAQTLLESSRALLRLPNVSLTHTPPGGDEVGASVQERGGKFWVVAPAKTRARSSSMADQEALEAMAAVTSDALSRLHLTAAMTRLASHDPLTGLPNRALLIERTRSAQRQARALGRRVAVLYCDLDGFKPVNDRFGHAAGDAVLVEIAERLASSVRRGDTVARMGGDEFAVLLEDVHGEDVDSTCDRLLTAVGAGVVIAEHHMPLSLSIGTALGDDSCETEALLQRADLAMYEAKAQGKNRYVTYGQRLGDSHAERLELVEALRAAVTGDQLDVAYQYITDVTTGRATGVEALARWSRNGEPVPPEVFIGLAEDNGLIVALGQQILHRVTLEAPVLQSAAGGSFGLGVNISAQQLRDPEFVTQMTTAMGQMPNVTMILEVTERCVVTDDEATMGAMTRLVEAGATFAIDDFGIGFSSLSYLKHLPVKILKTDAALSSDIDRDERSCRLLRSIVTMGDALGLDVIVEGIERPSQLEHLRDHVRAKFAQGYLLHWPESGEDVRHALLASLAGSS